MGSFFEVNRYCLDILQEILKFPRLSTNVDHNEVSMVYLRNKAFQVGLKIEVNFTEVNYFFDR